MFFIKSLKSKKKKLALTSFYYVNQEIWLGNSKNLICIYQSRFYIFSQPQVNFVLLCQSRNMVGQFKKAYLDIPIKILHFLTPAESQECIS